MFNLWANLIMRLERAEWKGIIIEIVGKLKN